MFAICIESSHSRGMGHLFRMLTLAERLQQRKISFRFFLNEHAPAEQRLREAGISYDRVDLSNSTSGWEKQAIERHHCKLWINDRLHTTREHAQRISESNIPLVTFDDRGTGAAVADINIACLAGFQDEPLEGKKILTDLSYLILNPEIEQHRRERCEPTPLLVTLGGTDTYGATLKVVDILKQSNTIATIVVGPGFEHMEELRSITQSNFTIKQNVPSLIAEFGTHNLAITGGGMTVFEALACGLPAIVVANEPHEIPIARRLEAFGAVRFAGFHEHLDPDRFNIPQDLSEMSRQALKCVPTGGADRVIDELIHL